MAKPIIQAVIIIYFLIMGLIVVHHQIIHDGIPFQSEDFKDAFYFMLKSHEGIVALMLVGGAGTALGVYLQKEYKLR